jgi:hypothetical protein
MFDRVRLLGLIDDAIRTDPACRTCGAAASIVEEPDGIYVRCSAEPPRGMLGRVGAALNPHLRVRIVETEELLAA